jgi:O-acetyl-ADP-ribose deacetylase (regulator of RNase III)
VEVLRSKYVLTTRPHVALSRCANGITILGNNGSLSRQSTTDTLGNEITHIGSRGYIPYEGEDEKSSKQPVLSVSDIPTLRSLYRSSRLLQRDQSYAPNDSYNRMISFCYHDLTRLKVDAIVNSSNLNVAEATDRLDRAVHKAGGPELTREARSKAKLKPGQVELTHGHALPCSWVIHAARPTYAALGSMGTFNILTECYRSALKMAGNYEMKTLAFPCIGTGLSGFPPRVAARIALQEVREYLEAHTDYRFERIVFCVNSAADEKAYMDFFPVFFPPTHGDLDRARTSDWSANRAALAAQILETRAQVQKVRDETIAGFSRTMPVAVNIVTTHLGRIDDRLSSIRGFLLGPQELKRSLGDLNLLCSVLLTVCGSIKEMIELSKDTMNSERTPEDIWKDNDAHMLDRHEVSLTQFLDECWIFAVSLDKVLTEAVPEIENVAAIRQRLESYGVKQKGQDSEGIRDHLDEVLYVREFQRGAASYGRHIVKLPHNSSVAKLYLLGELETKQTLAKPSVIFNEAVCLVREDITRLEVDVMVNSTDSSFLGMGTLDRTVLKKGGTGLQEEVKKFGKCNEGDVLLTPGYLLPAKHILHVIPPEQYRKNTKDILRKIYREVLHTALQMKATSVAIPSIGTGMLNYPRRDCASLAMEEVKRFLESAEPTNLIEKIVFVVYSSNDEFIYKSLLPIYFPPPQQVGPSRSVAQPTEVQGSSQLSKTTPTPRRSLFGSVGDALRGVRFGKQPETSRLINSYEEHALIEFERHAKYCITCKDIEGLYVKGRDLCDVGYRLAQTLLWYMNMLEDGHVYSMQGAEGKRDKVEVPSDIFPFSLRLLRTVERSSRDKDRKGLFVTQDHEFAAPPPELVQRKYDESAVSTVPDKDVIEQPAEPLYEPPAKIRAEVYTWKDDGVSSNWMPICIDFSSFIQVYKSRIDVHGPKYDKGDKNNETVLPNDIPILSLDLTSVETILRRESPKGVVIWGIGKKFASPFRGPVLFKTIHTAESDVLFGAFQRAINRTRQDVPLPKEMFGFTDSYAQWNQKLHNIQSQLDIKKQEGEQQSDTQSIVPDPSGGASKFGYSSTSLAAQILDYLTTDLKIRPGSYIGQRTNKIAFVLNKDPVAISASLQDLAAHQQVHNTIDGDTWVLSRSPTELPVLSQQSAERRKPDIYLLAAQVLSFMEHMDRTPTERKGQTVRELASALQLPTSDVWAAIRHLTARRQIHCPSDEETWVVTPQSGKATSQTQDVAHDTAPNVESTSPNEDATSASSLSERALSYLQRLEKAPGRGEHISDLASGLNTSIAELESVLPNLRDEGMVKNTDGNSYWAVALEPNTHQRDPGQSSSWVPSITLTQRTVENDYSDKEVVFSEVLKPSFTGNTLQSDVVEDPYYEPPPFNPGLEWTPQLDVYSDDIWHYVSFPASPDEGKKWTRIDKRIVDPQVMDGVVFEVLERNLLVQAELSMEQIHDLVEMTRARRMGKGKGKMDDEIVDQQPLLRSIAPNPPGSSGNKPARSSDAYPTPVPELDLSQVSAESIDLRAFVFRGIQDSRLNDQWHGQFTNIDIRLVDPEVLYDVGMAFEVQEQYVVVHGHLSEEGIRVLIEKSGTCKGDLSEPVTSYEASHTESKNVTVRDAAGFTDTPPSPTAEHYRHEDLIPDSTLRFDDNIRLGRSAVDARLLSDMIEDIDASGTSAISGTRWTRIDQRLVDARVLEEAGEDFENRGDNLILHRVLRRGEIEKWAEDTMRMRGQQESQDDATGEPEGPAPSLIEAMYEHFGGMVEFMRASNFDRRVKGMWTRIDRRLVDTWALMKVGEEFELLEEASVRNSAVSLLVHRVVGLEEIKAWAEETDEIRAVQDQENLMVGKEEEAEDLGESPEQTSAAGAEPEAGKPSRTERGDLNTRISRQPTKRGESWRDGRGEKDRQQAKLDRILAGDMKEDEQRHYRDSNSDSDTPPSPIQQPCHIVSDEGTEDAAPILDLDTINIKDYYDNDYTKSRSHGRWTRVDKRLVDEQILIEAGEEFHDGGEVFYVHRVLRRVEVELFAEQTRARRDVLRELWENARPRSPAQRPIEPPSDDEDSKVGMKKRFGLE